METVAQSDLNRQYGIDFVNPYAGDTQESYDYWMAPKAPEVTYFESTPFQVTIPVGRNPQRHRVQNISVEEFRDEPFNLYLRDLIIFTRVTVDGAAAPHLDTIIQRYNTDLPDFLRSVYGNALDQDKLKNQTDFWKQKISQATYAALVDGLKVPTSFATPESVASLYEISKDDPDLLVFALILDGRNKAKGQGINLDLKVKADLVPDLLKDDASEDLDKRLLGVVLFDSQVLLGSMKQALLQAQTKREIALVIRRVGEFTGIETIRKSLRDYLTDNPSFRPKFDQVFTYLGIDPGQEIAADLQEDVYNKIEFSEYKPNEETQSFELNLIEKEIGQSESAIDIGCGTGRLLIPLSRKPLRRISGIDQSAKHIRQIEEQSEVDARVASWFDIPFDDKTFDVAYCLGRSFTHNVTVQDAITSLVEIGRVVKDGGKIIIDLPDPSKGDYVGLIEQTRKVAKKRGIKKVLPGLINDSPDSQHYFDRLALSPSQFAAIAQLAGFETELIAAKSYHGISGQENTNLYYKLTKSTPPDQYTYYALSILLDRIYMDYGNYQSRKYMIFWGDPLRQTP